MSRDIEVPMADLPNESNDRVEMPAPTAWPVVLGLGIVLVAFGVATNLAFSVIGGVVFAFGLAGWIGQLVSRQGHIHEPLVGPEHRPAVPQPALGTVEALHPGHPGYRFRLPERVHPISSGVKGGIIGGLLMPIPALAYGLLAQSSLWFPVNLLAGMVVPGATDASLEDLRQFHLGVLLVGIVIHAAFAVTFGLMYGVVLPMLPPIHGGAIFFGGVLMPFLWTGVCYGMMGVVNPPLGAHVNWWWFGLSQLVFGLAMSFVVSRSELVAVSQLSPLQQVTR
jgi:hypothetical protein